MTFAARLSQNMLFSLFLFIIWPKQFNIISFQPKEVNRMQALWDCHGLRMGSDFSVCGGLYHAQDSDR